MFIGVASAKLRHGRARVQADADVPRDARRRLQLAGDTSRTLSPARRFVAPLEPRVAAPWERSMLIVHPRPARGARSTCIEPARGANATRGAGVAKSGSGPSLNLLSRRAATYPMTSAPALRPTPARSSIPLLYVRLPAPRPGPAMLDGARSRPRPVSHPNCDPDPPVECARKPRS